MANHTCTRCHHEVPPGAAECPGCGAARPAGGRSTLVGRRAVRRSRRQRVRRVALVVLALALLAYLVHLEWSDLSDPDAPREPAPARGASPEEPR